MISQVDVDQVRVPACRAVAIPENSTHGTTQCTNTAAQYLVRVRGLQGPTASASCRFGAGAKYTPAQCAESWRFGRWQSGTIDFSEFLLLLTRNMRTIDYAEEMLSAFRTFDQVMWPHTRPHHSLAVPH